MLSTKDLVSKYSDLTGATAVDARKHINSVLQVIGDIPNGETLVLRGFGTFRRYTKPSRTARNPQTGESVQVAAKDTLRFKCSDTLFH